MEKQAHDRWLSRDAIKYAAMLTMLLNHTAHMFLQPDTVLYEAFVDIGYFTAITMCYFLVEGYGYTRSKRKYGERLLLFAVISQIPYSIAFDIRMLNMLFTLFACFLILYVRERVYQPIRQTLLIALLFALTAFSDWGIFAPAFTLMFAASGSNRSRLAVSYLISAAAFAAYNYNPALPFWKAIARAVLPATGILASAVCILFFYNGRRAKWAGAFSKWFFYIFYPAHLLVLVFLRFIMQGSIFA